MSKTLFFSICTFLCVILSTGKVSASDNFELALRTFMQEKYFEASIAFERAAYYETDNNRVAVCKYYKAVCYRNLGENSKALEELDEVSLFSLPDSLYLLLRYEEALCNYLSNKIQQALWDLDDLKMKLRDTTEFFQVVPLQILCLNADRQWDNALTAWYSFLDHSNLTDSMLISCKQKVSALYKKSKVPRYYSPEKAENLSRFIPGSGQMYCGAIGEGSLNFLIHLSLLGFAGWEFYTRYWITGYFVGLGLFNKFYHGGMHRASLLAQQKNQSNTRRFNAKNTALMMRVFGTGTGFSNLRRSLKNSRPKAS